MESGGFTLVTKGKGARRRKGDIRTTVLKETPGRGVIDVDKAILKIKQAMVDLQASPFFDGLCRDLLPLVGGCDVIWCFGLGHLGECVTARYQVALLLVIRDQLGVTSGGVFVNDPIFYSEEVEILQKLRLNVALENIECKLRCEARTLLFLPHCPKQLVNNLLYSNWRPEKLINLVIFANSFSGTFERSRRRELEQGAGLLLKVVERGLVKEVPVKNNFKFEDIFNDSSIHSFQNLEVVEEDFWKVEEPQYGEEDTEFLRKSSSSGGH